MSTHIIINIVKSIKTLFFETTYLDLCGKKSEYFHTINIYFNHFTWNINETVYHFHARFTNQGGGYTICKYIYYFNPHLILIFLS